MGADRDDHYDVFMSYARVDGTRVEPMVRALKARGLHVWFDEKDVPDFASITTAIETGLACSKVLVAFYSAIYPTRRACQSELTAAFLAAQVEGDPRRRVLVVNPEPGAAHIEPVELRDARFVRAASPDDAAGLERLVDAVAARAGEHEGPLSAIRRYSRPEWYGWQGLGSARFVGRVRELWQLHSLLHSRDCAIITGAVAPGSAQVRGLGGIGKSLLAEEYALRFGAAFPGGIFWLRGQVDQGSQVEMFAAAFGIDRGTCRTPEEVRARLVARLRDLALPYLWVVDDLAVCIAEEERRAWYAPTVQGKTLITTRSRHQSGVGGVLDLTVLDQADAYQLLVERRKPSGAEEDVAAADIVRALGRHALAVDVARGYLASRPELTFAEFLGALGQSTRDELALAADLCDELPNGHEKSIAATLLRSIENLANEGRDLLLLGSVLAPVPIPRSLVADAFQGADGSSAEDAKLRADRAGKQAGDLSLVEPIDDQGTPCWTVHALVSRTVRFRKPAQSSSWARRLRAQSRPARSVAPERVGALRQAAVGVLIGVLHDVDDIRRHVKLLHCVEHARHVAGRAETLDEAKLLSWVARFEYERGAYSVARALQEKVFGEMRNLVGQNSPDTLRSMNDLAETLRMQGELTAARKLQERILKIRPRVMREDDPHALNFVNNLTVTLMDLGELAAAQDLQRRVLEIRRRALGDDHVDTLCSIGNLAHTLLLRGEVGSAQQLLEEAIPSTRNRLGDDHPATLSLIGKLAATLGEQGKVEAARKLCTQVYETRRRVFGEEHPETVNSKGNLAAILLRCHQPDAARRLQEQVLETRRRVFGEDHRATLSAMNNLAGTLRAQGEHGAALEIHQHVLEVTSRTLGEHHPQTTTSAWNLFIIARKVDPPSAEQVYQDYLAWLLLATPEALSAHQSAIRTRLSELDAF